MSISRTTLLVVLLALVIAAPAAAAPVIAFPDAHAGDVVVDETGTAHFIWLNPNSGNEGDSDTLFYCRVPLEATACTPRQTLPTLPLTLSTPQLLIDPDANKLVVVDNRGYGREEGLYTIVSTDGGITWTPHHVADSGIGLLDAELSTDGSTVNVVRGGDNPYGSGDNIFQSRAVDAPYSPGQVLIGRVDQANKESVAYQTIGLGYLRDGRLFVLGEEATGEAATPARKSAIRILTGENANDFAQWSPWSPTRPVYYDKLHIASGPTGPWVMYQGPHVYKDIGARWERWEIARISNTGKILAPELLTALYATYGGSNGGDLAQDPAGGLHAVWASVAEGCHNGGLCIVYRYRPPGGQFGVKAAVASIKNVRRSIFYPRVAADSNADGWVMWQDNAVTPTTFRATRLDPENTQKFGNAVVSLTGPRSCVKRKKGFTGVVSVRPVSGSGVKILQVAYSFREYPDHPVVKHLDKADPFSRSFPLGKFDKKGTRERKTRALATAVTLTYQGKKSTVLLKLPIDICDEN